MITLLEYIREYCMKRIVNVQGVIDKYIDPLTPTATRIMESIKKEADLMKGQWNGANKYQVLGSLGDQNLGKSLLLVKYMEGNILSQNTTNLWDQLLGEVHMSNNTFATQASCPGKEEPLHVNHAETLDTIRQHVKDKVETMQSASRQAQQTEPTVGQDGLGGLGAGAVIGLSVVAGEGSAGDPGGAGFASQVIDNRKFMMVDEEDLIFKKISPMAEEILKMLCVCVAKKRRKDRNIMKYQSRSYGKRLCKPLLCGGDLRAYVSVVGGTDDRGERKSRKGKNQIKTRQKQEAWRSPRKSKPITNSSNDSPSISKNSSQSPLYINHHCCYECGDALGIFCQRCTCKSCGKGAHIGYNCPPKVLIISNLESCNQTMNNEPPQTLPSFDPTCYSEKDNSLPCVSKPNLVDESPNVFNPPSQPPIILVNFVGAMLNMVTTCQPMNQNFYNSNSLGFDQTQPPPFLVIHPPPQETSIKILHDQENVINAVQTFLRKFNRYSFFETPKVLLLAWDRIFEIKDAFGNKQYKPEDIQELFRKLLNDVQNIHEELAKYINTLGWNRPAFYNNGNDDDVDYTIAITPVLFTEEPDNSLSMGDEHLDTISATESDEVIKSSVEDLVSIPSESEGIPDTMCDMHLVNNPTPLEAKDHFEIVISSKDDYSSSDNYSLYNENIEYVEASPHDSELVSLKVAEIVIQKDEEIEDDYLREKLLKSSSTFPKSVLEETNTFDDSLPEFENFCFDLEEISSGSFDQTQPPQFPVIHPLPQETSIEILHDQENVINDVQTFLRRFNRFSFFETPKVLLRAWDRVFEIKDAFGNKQYKPEDIQELFRKLLNDVQNIHEELAEYINTPGWNRPAFYNNGDDDDVDYTIAITPILSTEDPDNSLSMGDKHLDTILTTESDEVIKSSVEDLVPIPSESEGIPDTMCDVHLVNNPTPLEAKDHFEIVINSNDDYSSSDNDTLYNENIEYVQASPHGSELVSLEVAEIVIPEDEKIEDDILREKLLKVNLLIAKIEALKDNSTPSFEFLTKSSSTFPKSILEETNTFDDSLPEFENFCFDLEEISSGSTTTHSDMSFSDYATFSFYDDHIEEISSGSTTSHSGISLSEYDSFIFDLSNDQFTPTDRSDSTHEEFADELAHIISPLEYDCFYFGSFPDPGEWISSLNSRIRKNLSSTTRVNLPVEDDHSPLLAYVVWIFLAYITYPVIPPHLHLFGNEDTIFDLGITINHFYLFKLGLSHWCGTVKKFNTHRSHLNKCPMLIHGQNNPPLDVLLFHFYPS
nr:hypothetical protein [Tanacetum cinerariifolium]